MKTGYKSLFATIVGAAVAAALWNPQLSPSQIAVTPDPAAPSTAGVGSQIAQPYARTPMLGAADPRWKMYHEKRKLDPTFEWRTPITFYGKVVDENNQAVAGALIEFAWNGTPEKYGGDGVGRRSLTSDSNGMFTLSGVEGKGMTVYVSKEGYHRRSEANGWFEYAGFWEPSFIEPDRNKPVIFHLVKRPFAEPTLRIGERLLLPPPSWITHVDLLNKPAQQSVGGDLTIRIIRPANPGYQNLFDWEISIEGNGGAELVESDDEFMLRAPSKGYASRIAKRFEEVRGNSIEQIRFYVRNKARKLYAAIELEVTPYYPMMDVDRSCVIISATVNPNDSPNLEYDPQKDIRKMARKD